MLLCPVKGCKFRWSHKGCEDGVDKASMEEGVHRKGRIPRTSQVCEAVEALWSERTRIVGESKSTCSVVVGDPQRWPRRMTEFPAEPAATLQTYKLPGGSTRDS